MEKLLDALNITAPIKDTLLALKPAIYIVATIVVAALMLVIIKRLPQKMIDGAKKRAEQNRAKHVPIKRIETAATIVASVLKYLVYIIAIANIASQLGFGTAVKSVLTFAGVGGIIVGLASQSLLSDVVNGIFILLEDQFAVGDYVLVNGVEGTVENISIRTISVRAYGGELSIIPNSTVKTLTNYSRSDSLAVADIPVAMDAPVERALKLMEEEGLRLYDELGDAATQKPQIVGLNGFTPGAKVLRIVMKVKPLEHWQTRRMLNRRITERFIKEGIPLPFEGGNTQDDRRI